METKKQSRQRLHLAIFKQIIVLATSGFGLVAALAWNNVIQELVNEYIKPYFNQNSGLFSLIIYALIITIFAVSVTVYLSEVIEKLESNDQSSE